MYSKYGMLWNGILVNVKEDDCSFNQQAFQDFQLIIRFLIGLYVFHWK